MFRITANYDDPWHPLQDDVTAVASVAEAMAAMPDVDWAEWHLDNLETGDREEFYGFGVTYTVERI